MPRARTQQADLLHRSSMTYDHSPYKNYCYYKNGHCAFCPVQCCCPIFPCQTWCRIHGLLWGYAISPAAQTKLLTTRGIYHLTVSIGQESSLRVSQGCSQDAGQAGVSSGTLGPHPSSCGCWWKSAPCSYRTEVPMILLVVSWGLLSASRYHPLMPATWPSARPSLNRAVDFLSASRSISPFGKDPVPLLMTFTWLSPAHMEIISFWWTGIN